MEKSKTYYQTRFGIDTIKESLNLFFPEIINNEPEYLLAEITNGNERWKFDNLEEFFSDYNNASSYSIDLHFDTILHNFRIIGFKTYVTITITSKNRKSIESTFQVFERDLEKSRIIIHSEPVSVFIGHGGDNQWRLLKEHLQEIHGFNVVAYEIGSRAGKSIKDVLQEMLNRSSIAFLILTGEDSKNYNEIHARQNVIHELGLFQGKLGFERAIIVLEIGVTEFSNILGVNQIRFSKDNIRESFGDVLGVIRREFSNNY